MVETISIRWNFCRNDIEPTSFRPAVAHAHWVVVVPRAQRSGPEQSPLAACLQGQQIDWISSAPSTSLPPGTWKQVLARSHAGAWHAGVALERWKPAPLNWSCPRPDPHRLKVCLNPEAAGRQASWPGPPGVAVVSFSSSAPQSSVEGSRPRADPRLAIAVIIRNLIPPSEKWTSYQRQINAIFVETTSIGKPLLPRPSDRPSA